jgi:hypothetical protein
MRGSILAKEPAAEFIGIGEVKGFKFKRVFANEKYFIYSVTNDQITWYEVFKLKPHGMYGHIMYPKAKAFGIWAWSVSTFEKALLKTKKG